MQGQGTGSGNDRQGAEGARKHGDTGHGVGLSLAAVFQVNVTRTVQGSKDIPMAFPVVTRDKTAWENAGRHL